MDKKERLGPALSDSAWAGDSGCLETEFGMKSAWQFRGRTLSHLEYRYVGYDRLGMET